MAPYFDFIDEANLPNPTYVETGSTHTSGYSAPNPPPVRQIPSHIVHDPQLPQKMRGCLRSYLTTRCGQRLVSDELVAGLNLARLRMGQNLPNITSERTARLFFWMNVVAVVQDFVFDVDGVGVHLTEAPTSYGTTEDGIWGGRVHVEFKSVREMLHHVDEIINLGKKNHGRGSELVLGAHEAGGRSIIFKIGISMVTNNLTWGILTSGLVSIFFHRHEVPDLNGESHHVLSCSNPIYVDAACPSVFSLYAAMLLGAHDAHAFSLRPPSTRLTVQPYSLPPDAGPSKATRSHTGRHRGSKTTRLSSAQKPRGSTSRQPRHLIKCSRTLLGVRRLATSGYRVEVRGWCLWKCPTLRVQFVVSYWPDVVYNVRRVRSGASLFSGLTGQMTAGRFPPPHLKLYERVGRGESGQVLDGTVYMPQSRAKHNVVAKLFLRAHLDKLHNEIHLYQTRLVGLCNKAVPKVFGAFVTRGSTRVVATAETMEKWGIIVMEKCGSVVQSVDELTVDQREAAYRCLCLIHQAGVEHCGFHLNNVLFSSGVVRVIDFSEAVEHDCSGPDCYELRMARKYLKLPPRLTSC